MSQNARSREITTSRSFRRRNRQNWNCMRPRKKLIASMVKRNQRQKTAHQPLRKFPAFRSLSLSMIWLKKQPPIQLYIDGHNLSSMVSCTMETLLSSIPTLAPERALQPPNSGSAFPKVLYWSSLEPRRVSSPYTTSIPNSVKLITSTGMAKTRNIFPMIFTISASKRIFYPKRSLTSCENIATSSRETSQYSSTT